MVLALRRRGHSVTAFAPIVGPAIGEIRATGSPVATSLSSLEAPDIIHGHHTGPTIAALARFPGTPAIFVCHDFSSELDAPPIHPRISRYLHVRAALRGRLVDECGIEASKVKFWPNTIDLQRIGPAALAPDRLSTAAIFAHPGTIPFTGMIAEACKRHGIGFRGELIGKAAYDVVNRLDGTDLAFASGRMALEAIARGCAVINVDRFGAGGLVTMDRFADFAAVNFAYGALSDAASPDLLDREIARYSAEDAMAVTERVRRDFASDKGAEQLEAVYRDVLAERSWPRREANEDERAMAAIIERFLQQKRIYDRSFLRLREGLGPSEELQFQMGELASRTAELSEEVRRLRRGGLLRRLLDKLTGRTYEN
ncbi:glycosyltransferase [Aminobacter carboxidus]|nr:glycosyltransferase [Aminobacter carboxidus]MBE1204376.1 glycosyltransferase [Aminobacter carboxidus]